MSTITNIELDSYQVALAQRLGDLALSVQRAHDTRTSIPAIVRRVFGRTHLPEKGLYIWGGVGRGKTMLMDRFYESLTFDKKRRWHFHRFMQDIHEKLNELSGNSNPLQEVADQIRQNASVVCLDEFFVSDIGDAMILSELLESIFERNIVLVATSNLVPEMLYENGLQRRRFLPAIELIKTHMEIVFLGGDDDYRLKALLNRDLYRISAKATPQLIDQDSAELVGSSHRKTSPLIVNKRKIECVYRGEGIVAFGFKELCEGPRSASDYIEIARTHHTVLIYDVPELSLGKEEASKRFINAIDVFYDRNVNLVLHAHKPIGSLYIGVRFTKEFQRTRSRIAEMSSTEYLTRAHRA
ncbi:MAG: cell division protein ZapE [Gammaproteobacteria bacterium]|nr:cell division protein ZapE [Gammaproteobacteria bacterium]